MGQQGGALLCALHPQPSSTVVTKLLGTCTLSGSIFTGHTCQPHGETTSQGDHHTVTSAKRHQRLASNQELLHGETAPNFDLEEQGETKQEDIGTPADTAAALQQNESLGLGRPGPPGPTETGHSISSFQGCFIPE